MSTTCCAPLTVASRSEAGREPPLSAALVRSLDHLGRTLPEQQLRVLDVGCGAGADAVALAARGAQVTALDSSAAMLRRTGVAARAAGVADRVHLIQADIRELRSLSELTGHRSGGSGSYDLVLCHDVLQHRPGGVEMLMGDLAVLASSVRPGGYLSVLTGRPVADVLRAATGWAAIVEKLDVVEQAADAGDREGSPASGGFWHLTARRRAAADRRGAVIAPEVIG